MPSAKRFYVFDSGPLFRRDDPLITYLNGFYQDSGEFLVDKLGAEIDEMWKSHRGRGTGAVRMRGYGEESVFGDTVETRSIADQGPMVERLIQFADKFGTIYRVIEPGTRHFLIGAIINDKRYGSLIVSTNKPNKELPSAFLVGQSFPDPFSSIVTMEYHLPRAGMVEAAAYNALGMKEGEMRKRRCMNIG
jgi:hypothetical protein